MTQARRNIRFIGELLNLLNSPKTADDVLGRRVDDILGVSAHVVAGDGTTTEGAAASRRSHSNRDPAVVPLRCASGAYKSVTLTALAIVSGSAAGTVLVNLFDEPVGAAAAASEQPQSAAPAPLRVPYVDSGVTRLSAREHEVLELVAAGRSPEQIAHTLSISIHTVRNHVRNLRSKLKAKTKLDAVMTAVRQGLL